jgi:hypothetical protein
VWTTSPAKMECGCAMIVPPEPVVQGIAAPIVTRRAATRLLIMSTRQYSTGFSSVSAIFEASPSTTHSGSQCRGLDPACFVLG